MSTTARELSTEFELPTLPYALEALEPHISRETLQYHYGKHHSGYVSKLNQLVNGTRYEGLSLERIVQTADGMPFNNAAQVWNHSFYWNCLSPEGGGQPGGRLATSIIASFGSHEAFVERFTAAATGKFGSGWTWLVRRPDGSLAIENTDDADTPLRHGKEPLLTCDVWEHAYYIDYRNARGKYVEAFFRVVNWDFVAANHER